MSSVAAVGQSSRWQGIRCHQTPDDLFNLAEVVFDVRPATILEVGTGDGGTALFLGDIQDRPIYTIDKGDVAPMLLLASLILLDGDVYSEIAIARDLETYGPLAQWLVVCHTMRPDWGSVRAVAAWLPNHHEWARLDVPHPTQHTWLVRR